MTTATDLNIPFSSAEYKRVKCVKFSVFDAETIKGYSVAEVTELDIYKDGKPKAGGVNDERLGPCDSRGICATCGEGIKTCPGHWGHLELARPMFHYGFLKSTLNVLRCVCYYCSRMLADPREAKMIGATKMLDPKKRLSAVMLCCRTKKRCAVKDDENMDVDQGGEAKYGGGCGYLQPHYRIEATEVLVQFPEAGEDVGKGEDRKRRMTAEEALTIFRRISDKDIIRMGMHPQVNHPANLILTTFPIPPPHVRPSVAMGSARSEDDVTQKLMDIIKTNDMLKKQVQVGAGEHIINEFAKLLQYHIYTLSDNTIIGIPRATTKSRRPLKSIRERLKSKEGRLRGNLMGKRVDFCARTVIGGDANLDTEQVGVPKSIALNLTFPERVTPHNFAELKRAIANGPTKWPGARYIIREDGSRVDLRYVADTTAIELKYGWKVERHMLDGDYVIFNRQPSLHKMSMMGHRAKVMPFSTMRFNLAVTSPYNADFDGDEMNLHLAQTHETRSEIKHMMLNPRMVVSPQGNKPVMGIVQDSLLACSKFTRRDTFLEKDLAMNIMMWIPGWDGVMPTPCILKPKPLWSGKQIFSRLLPEGLSMRRESAIASKNKKDHPDFSESDCKVLIQQGELLSGIVCKKTVGSSSGSLIHLCWLDHGVEATRNFISYVQKVVNQWLTHNGFSCGVADIIANDDTLLSVEKTLKQAKVEVRKILADAQRGKLETQPGKTMYQSFEAKVNQRLNAAREDAGRIGSDALDERNNIISMVNAGSKGSPINIAQIIACVGQQNVEGARIRYGFIDRTLPHFTKDDYGAESRGFVENSYLAGLTPQEVWMHAMGGREGVIDTACKTSETGYIQRRLVKSMETLSCKYDGTSRNANNDIIQFLYGEDGMDGVLIEDQTLDIMTFDHDKLSDKLKHHYLSDDYGLSWLPPDVLAEIKESAEVQAVLDREWETLTTYKKIICEDVFPDGDSKQHMPINISRLISRAKIRAKVEDRKETEKRYTPQEVIQKVEHLMESLEITRAIQEGDTIGREVEDNAKVILNAHLRCNLASRRILEEENLTKQSFDWLLGEIKQRFYKSQVNPGEVVGTLAAQSVGEPATQMTLNTFHFAGVGAKNVTLGVPRLKELINVAKKVKTPSLAVFLNGDLGKDQERAKDVQSLLEHTTLEKVTSFTQIFWDPDPVNTRIMEDKEWVAEYYELPDEEEDPARCGPWLLRIQLSNKVMTDKKLTVREVGERIMHDFESQLDCIFTDDNAEDLVLRIRLLKEGDEVDAEPEAYNEEDDKDDRDYRFLRAIESNILKELTLRGVLGIKKVFMREENVARYVPGKGNFERTKEWVLDTDGVNLEEVMHIPEVDFTRLQSNDIVEILGILGIEAVRKALLFHIRMVISFDGSYVNYRHMGTMCDCMTNRGHLMAITRHGINRTNMGPLMKCSFEETVEILMDAAVYAENDYMRSVSENIIMGNLVPVGTGAFDLYMDDKRERLQMQDGSVALGACRLDEAQPVLPGRKNDQLFSMSTPIDSPGRTPGDAARSPLGDEVHNDLLQRPTSAVNAPPIGASPLVSPPDEEEAHPSRGMSPFSPNDPVQSPLSGFGTPITESIYERGRYTTQMSSPMSAAAMSPQSPVYSPVSEADPGEVRHGIVTPPARPAEVSSEGDTRRSQYSLATTFQTRTAAAASMGGTSSEAYGHSAMSPSYEPSLYSGYSAYGQTSSMMSPDYTMTPRYSPYSVAYSPSGILPSGLASTGAASSRRPGEAVPAEPRVQAVQPESPLGDNPTSPVYTPHQERATGDMTSYMSEHGRSTLPPVSPGAHSLVFEPSDDEDM
mmetsp:Transcript_51028/g.119359  ORF Transcript_51028/g.119359 Transcript_51028/m.119359 type:complete len:1818 (+) Transcript_51028:98-5551(+)